MDVCKIIYKGIFSCIYRWKMGIVVIGGFGVVNVLYEFEKFKYLNVVNMILYKVMLV